MIKGFISMTQLSDVMVADVDGAITVGAPNSTSDDLANLSFWTMEIKKNLDVYAILFLRRDVAAE